MVQPIEGVIGTSLLFAGLAIALYSIMPTSAWIGVVLGSVGVGIMFETQKSKMMRNGLKLYIPSWINEYLTRQDLIEHVVAKIRANDTIQKFIRLILIKVVDLSRDEIVEVLAGIWPRFRDLSNHEGSLIEFTPDWFRRLYSGSVIKKIKQPRAIASPELPCTPELDHYEDNVDDLSPSSVATRHVIDDALAAPQRYELYPLLMWIAEKRVRKGVSSAGPIAAKFFKRALLPSIVTILLWKKLPKSRKPLSHLFVLLMFVYVVSITRGLPAVPFERVFKFLNISYRQPNRTRRTSPTTGSLGAVLYALLEPLIPTINTPPRQELKFYVTPSSPAPSQASTMEPSIPSL